MMKQDRVLSVAKRTGVVAMVLMTLTACSNPYSPGDRALGGGLLGAGGGAAIGALDGGGRGAAIGALAGGALGATVGAVTTPNQTNAQYQGGDYRQGYAQQPGYYPQQNPYQQPSYPQGQYYR